MPSGFWSTLLRDIAACASICQQYRKVSFAAGTSSNPRSVGAAMQRFRQMKTLQKLGSANTNIHNHFGLQCHLVEQSTYKERRLAALAAGQINAS
jgi:hypothetical protein